MTNVAFRVAIEEILGKVTTPLMSQSCSHLLANSIVTRRGLN